ncbi:aldehyde dehydrogenase (NADP(+)) [Simiduia litorea]|uniref:aldehyde dehydrogenase (NADP(+)) n=1 Tax=Simiduia litorea TaxID=1435348 RepID=UPI0036F3D6A8
MKVTGEMLIGARAVMGSQKPIFAVNPATGESIQPAFASGEAQQVAEACTLAASAFDGYRNLPLPARADFLDVIAQQIMALGDPLVQRAMAETGLPRTRIEGERARTVGQLRLFAALVRDGNYQDARIDPAQPERKPLARLDHRYRNVALGPVAVFGASNFPLAFSVAGGDTASALAAGCPVIVKAHSSHPGTSALVGRAVQTAVQICGLHEGVFSLLFGSGAQVGASLVAHPSVKAVGFTGSQAGGMALMAIAAQRKEPIPVYAEMSSINPVFLLPKALENRAEIIAEMHVASMLMGAGQFCTSPGLVIGVKGAGLNRYLDKAATNLVSVASQTMLSPSIHKAYLAGVERVSSAPGVREIARSLHSADACQCQAGLYLVSGADFIANAQLHEEVFGSLALVVECDNEAQMFDVLAQLQGQLTGAIHADDDDDPAWVQQLITALELKVGRIIWNGFGTGVEVCHAMVHGGPFPATSNSRTSSVGSAAIMRFLRPVCYQQLPDVFLPAALQATNPEKLQRLVDGKRHGSAKP